MTGDTKYAIFFCRDSGQKNLLILNHQFEIFLKKNPAYHYFLPFYQNYGAKNPVF